MELLHSVKVPQDVDEGVGRVGVSTESHLRESDVVVDGDVAGGDLGELGLSGEGDVVHDLKSDCGQKRGGRIQQGEQKGKAKTRSTNGCSLRGGRGLGGGR